jgi:hypothetical protein
MDWYAYLPICLLLLHCSMSKRQWPPATVSLLGATLSRKAKVSSSRAPWNLEMWPPLCLLL